MTSAIVLSLHVSPSLKLTYVQDITKFHHMHYAESQQHLTSAVQIIALLLQRSITITVFFQFTITPAIPKAHYRERNLQFSRFLAVNKLV